MIDPTDYLLPGAAYLVALLGLFAAHAFRPSCSPGWRKWRYGLLALFIWSWVFSSPGFADQLLAAIEGPPVSPVAPQVKKGERPLVVVLGSGRLFAKAGVPAPRVSSEGWERFRTAIAIWREAGGGTILFTGGPVPGASLSGILRQVAVDSGVPPALILTTVSSRTTYEDLAQSRDLILGHPGPVWIVTSAVHMPRTLAVARHLGLSVTPIPCDYRQLEAPTWRAFAPDDGGPALWSTVLHELVGRLWYRLKGLSD